MFATKRVRIAATALTVALLSGGIAAAVTSTASASPRPKPAATSTRHHPGKLTLTRFDLKGYVINAKYTLGRNTGNTSSRPTRAPPSSASPSPGRTSA